MMMLTYEYEVVHEPIAGFQLQYNGIIDPPRPGRRIFADDKCVVLNDEEDGIIPTLWLSEWGYGDSPMLFPPLFSVLIFRERLYVVLTLVYPPVMVFPPSDGHYNFDDGLMGYRIEVDDFHRWVSRMWIGGGDVDVAERAVTTLLRD